jgi:hypothetical protein
MKKTKDFAMRNKITITIMSILLVGLVLAGGAITATSFTKTTEIDKITRDYLLTKVISATDSKGDELPKEIKPQISIRCFDNYCLYDTAQEGIIQSYDNSISREYCKKTDDKTGFCIEQGIYTIVEIEEKVSQEVSSRLGSYVTSDKNKEEPKEISKGTLEIMEKK